MDKVNLKIDWATHKAAKYACENWHYSGTVPASRSAYIGAWENGNFIGVIIFSLGASPSLGNPYGLKMTECCELTRVALRQHQSEVTKMIAVGIIMLKKANPKSRLIVSFADTFHGHHGGIYQGGNWIYSGDTDISKMYKLPNGQLVDPRRYNGHGHNKKQPIPMGAILINTTPKHRYLMPLDKKMRKQILPLSKPYPKRPKQAMDSTTVTAAGQNRPGRSSNTKDKK